MTITIHQSIQDSDSISRKAQLVLSLIPEGSQWLEASMSPTSPNYIFDSEVEFLSAVLDGLHNTELVYIPLVSLMIAPDKLMTLSQTDLENLNSAIANSDEEQAQSVCDSNGLLTNSQLEQQTAQFLKKCKLNNNALFNVMTLNDYIAINDIAGKFDSTGDSILKEAANTAVSTSQTPIEFSEYLSFYLIATNRLNLAKLSTEQRSQQINNVYQALLPYAFDMLICPKISGPTDKEDVNQAIVSWLDYGNFIGFSSLACTLSQLLQNVDLSDLSKPAITQTVKEYTNRIKQFLKKNPVETPALIQDGSKLIYPVYDDDPVVRLALDQQGSLTLEEFCYSSPINNTED